MTHNEAIETLERIAQVAEHLVELPGDAADLRAVADMLRREKDFVEAAMACASDWEEAMIYEGDQSRPELTMRAAYRALVGEGDKTP